MDMQCSMRHYTDTNCGPSPKSTVKDYQIVPLATCCRDIEAHLLSFHLTTDPGLTSEPQLILARCGKWDEDPSLMTICPAHRDSLGIAWKTTKRNCTHPGSESDTGCGLKAHDRRRVNTSISKKVQENFHLLIPVGSKICSFHLKQYSNPKEETPKQHLIQQVVQPSKGFDPDSQGSSLLTDDSQPILFSQPLSEGSEFLPSQLSKDHKRMQLDSFLEVCDLSPVKKTLTVPWEDASERTKRDYTVKVSKIVSNVAKILAPSDAEKLVESVITNLHNSDTEQEASVDLKALAAAYRLQEQWDMRRQILSIVCANHSQAEVRKELPEVTEFKYKSARQHSDIHGCGAQVTREVITRARVNETQIEHFIQFVTDFHMVDLPFGETTVTLSTREQLRMPQAALLSVPERIVQQYRHYCEEVQFTCPSDNTLRRILKDCSTTYRHSLQGLNYFVAEGSKAFQDMLDIVQSIEPYVSSEWQSRTCEQLQQAKRYLKMEYKLHVSREAVVADHCELYALDAQDSDFTEVCTHDHTASCSDCCKLDAVMAELETALSQAVDDDEYPELLYMFDQSKAAILSLKSHILRACHQDQARKDIIDTLDSSHALLIQDWAMKFLPRKFRESQSDWFGKRGISWHITVAYYKPEDEVETLTFVHIFDSCQQGSTVVTAIMHHVMQELAAASHGAIRHVVYRQDNASCYHNVFMLWAAMEISRKTHVTIQRVDFSEAQDGKGACDRKCGQLKAHILRYINEGNDVVNAQDLKKAIESNGGLSSCSVQVCELFDEEAPVKLSLSNISYYTNFTITAEGLQVWRAYNIGPGKFIPWSRVVRHKKVRLPILSLIEPPVNSVVSSNPAAVPAGSTASSSLPSTSSSLPSTSHSRALFTCNEENCYATFSTYKAFQKHLDVGKHSHELQNLTVHDKAKLAFKKQTNIRQGSLQKLGSLSEVETRVPALKPGWALKTKTKATRFSECQKKFLTDNFLEGERSGRKKTPEAVAKAMRVVKDQNGKRLFQHMEFLSASQVQGFWQRLATKQRTTGLSDLTSAIHSSTLDGITSAIADSINNTQ